MEKKDNYKVFFLGEKEPKIISSHSMQEAAIILSAEKIMKDEHTVIEYIENDKGEKYYGDISFKVFARDGITEQTMQLNKVFGASPMSEVSYFKGLRDFGVDDIKKCSEYGLKKEKLKESLKQYEITK